MLVVATSDALHVRQMADTARTLNPDIEIVLRTHSADEAVLLRHDAIGTVFLGEDELARNMASHVLERFAAPAAVAQPAGH
jgi:CPA2 family monovalent cation:H+ antiporter-2